MNLEEAKEILAGSPIGRTGEFCKAEGFLEGHASAKKEMIEKFRPVVEALEECLAYMQHIKKYLRPNSEWFKQKKEVFESYRRDISGEIFGESPAMNVLQDKAVIKKIGDVSGETE